MGMRTDPETNASAPGWGITYGAQNPKPGGTNMQKSGLGFDSSGNPFIRNVNGLTVFEAPNLAAATVLKQPVTVRVPIAAADTAGGVFAWANPTGASIIIKSLAIDVTTVSTGACTIDCGVAANGTTLSDTLIDGASTASTARVIDNIKDAGTNGTSIQKCTSSQYVTGSVASGASAGIVGFAYITYHPI